MIPVYIARSAWEVIIKEVNFFANHKNGQKEAVVYSFFNFVRSRECVKAPWEMLELEDLNCFVVTHAHAPMREFCNHTQFLGEFIFSNEEERQIWEQDIDSWKNRIWINCPNLIIGTVHSHPFAVGHTYPSKGENGDYTRIYKYWNYSKSCNINTPLEIIICKPSKGKKEWKACCFGFDKKQKIICFDDIKIIEDNDSIIRHALQKPFVLRRDGVEWEKKQSEVIDRVERSFFGTSYRIKLDEKNFLLVHLPYSFPSKDNVLFQVFDSELKTWSKMQIWNKKKSFSKKYLHKIINYTKGNLL